MLDLARLVDKLPALVAERASEQQRAANAADAARMVLAGCEADWQSIADRVARLKTNRLIAIPREAPTARISPAAPPKCHTVLAVDGSQIAPDRHESVYCCVLNVGLVAIHYSDPPQRSHLSTVPDLQFDRESLCDEDKEGELRLITEAGLSLRRTATELSHLQRLIETQGELPTVAFSDGSLLFWTLQREPKRTADQVLAGLTAALEAGLARRTPIAGFLSRPGSRDVVQLAELIACGLESAPCEAKCSYANGRRAEQPCELFSGLTDRQLFGYALQPGQRSTLYMSNSKAHESYPDQHWIAFFYLHTGREIARVEIPRWVADDGELLARVHAVAWDQCEKGAGYPRALSEAHEQAVVRGPDRAAFYHLIERALVREGMEVAVTQKALAKRTRAV